MARGSRTQEPVVNPTVPEEPAAPVALVFVSPHGFIDDHGDRWHWHSGDVVRNPYVVGLLLERGAPVQEV